MKSKRLLVILGIAAVVLIIILVLGKKQGWFGDEGLLKVAVQKTEKRDIVEVITANGKIQPETEVIISPDVSGEIVDLVVKEGDDVVKGQYLLKIKPEEYIMARNRSEAALNSAKARLKQSEAQLEQSSLDYKRNKQLFEQQAISEAEYEQSTTTYSTSQAEKEAAEFAVQSAMASLNEAQENLTKTSIYAPMTGTISKLEVELGERVVGTSLMSGTPLLRIADLNRMEVEVEVNENEIVLQDEELQTGKVPDVLGMGASNAIYLLENAGLRVIIKGVGKVKQQSLSPGTTIKPGQTVYLTLS